VSGLAAARSALCASERTLERCKAAEQAARAVSEELAAARAARIAAGAQRVLADSAEGRPQSAVEVVADTAHQLREMQAADRLEMASRAVVEAAKFVERDRKALAAAVAAHREAARQSALAERRAKFEAYQRTRALEAAERADLIGSLAVLGPEGIADHEWVLDVDRRTGHLCEDIQFGFMPLVTAPIGSPLADRLLGNRNESRAQVDAGTRAWRARLEELVNAEPMASPSDAQAAA
jgi:hypothetical protein